MIKAPSYPHLPPLQTPSASLTPSVHNERLFEPRPAPNFLIVGAARAGTTSLWQWLRGHPQVFMTRYKEPAFFVHNFGVFNQEKYLSLFKAGRGKPCIGEASTAYLSSPESPPWIHDVLGRVKIIMVLRNPVARAYSMYCWLTMIGLEPLATFEEALTQESRRMTSLPFRQNCPIDFHNYQYFNAGLYI
ncbi:MAG: sulfotransferase domain-containing protein, partial [Opitutaceae bacterium]